MKTSVKKFLLYITIIFSVCSLLTIYLANVLLNLWWIYSLNIINSILKLFLIRWISIPVLGIFLGIFSLLHLISASPKERQNKKFLFLKTTSIILIITITEHYTQLSQSILNIFLGGMTQVHDPLLNLDFSFYLFIIPLLQKSAIIFSIYALSLLIFRFIANTMYKVRTLHLVDRLLILSIIFWGIILLLIHRFSTIHSSIQNYIGYLDIYGNFLPFAISLFVGFIFALIALIKPNQKLVAIGSIFVILFGVLANSIWPWYIEDFIYQPNQSTLQEKFAGLHAESTRRSFGLQSISHDTNNINKKEDLPKILSKNFWQDERHFLKILQQNQEILPIFQIQDVNPILLSNKDGDFSPYLISARESANNPSDLWDIKLFRNIFGYGAVIGAANSFDKEGFAHLVLKNLTLDTNSLDLPIKNPYVFFSEEYNGSIFINTSMILPNFKKENFPLEALKFKKVNGLPVNLFTRILLTIVYRDSRFLLTDYFLPDSQFIYQRKPRTIAKAILPQFQYSKPILQYHDQELWWEMDAYTTSSSLYLSKSVNTPWGKFNWLQSPMKVFVSAYSGEVIFDVSEPNNPYVRIAQKLYPQLFKKTLNLPSEQYSYPRDLFHIQGELLQTYHDTNASSYYSQINQREINALDASLISFAYKMLPNKNRIALQQSYNPAGKNILAALFTAYIGENKQKVLSMYTASSGSGIPGVAQASAFLNQNPEFSQKATLWGQGGSSISSSRMIFYPIENTGIYANSIYLESESNSIPMAAQFAIIDSSIVSLGDTIDQAIYQALKDINTTYIPISEEQQLRSAIADAYHNYLLAEQARIKGNTQEYQEYVDKIGVALQSITKLN